MALHTIDTRLTGASTYSGSLHPTKCKPGMHIAFGVQRARARTNTALQGVAKLTFMAGIAAGILLTWQGITLHVQQFSVRPDTETSVATMVRWVHTAWRSLPEIRPAAAPDDAAFAAEQGMNRHQLLDRWNSLIGQAAQRFSIPGAWIRAVMQTESGGRTMSAAFKPITSRVGAMGLMQLMPATYAQMRVQYHLGMNPYDPHDNVIAGVAYLGWLYHKYGYPAMFAAYNDGPGHLEERLTKGGLLPAETRNYVTHIVTALGGKTAGAEIAGSGAVKFTRPNGTPVKVDLADVTSVRVPLPGEYADSVRAVLTIRNIRQGVRESYDEVKQAMLAHGALGSPIEKTSARLAELVDGAPSHHRTRRHERIAAAKHRLRASYDVADTIKLHPVSHRAQS
ncbi:MAG TPA: lytic transglycosylase domain-containing protein [Rhizomicrobium sp.]|nr:lytic transglycosylase domain-containing protein [Rhizomicrobium sp.]